MTDRTEHAGSNLQTFGGDDFFKRLSHSDEKQHDEEDLDDDVLSLMPEKLDI